MAQADFTKALRDREEITITVKGRRSGRDIKLPVWFTQEGTTLWLLPVHGSRTQWFRNVLVDPISSNVVALNLPLIGDGPAAVIAHAVRGTHVVLTYGQLSAAGVQWPPGVP